jgi:hypothetical protein
VLAAHRLYEAGLGDIDEGRLAQETVGRGNPDRGWYAACGRARLHATR